MNPAQFSPSNILDHLLQMSASKRAKAEAAVAGRKREQEQQGLRSYAPNDATKVAGELSRRLLDSSLSNDIYESFLPNRKKYLDKYYSGDFLHRSVPYETRKKEEELAVGQDLPNAQITQRPSGGVIVRTPDKTLVTSKYGTGVALPKSSGKKTIEGIPADEWYAQAAARQGQNNKYAASLPNGRGIAFAATDKMTPEKQKALVYDAMNRKRA